MLFLTYMLGYDFTFTSAVRNLYLQVDPFGKISFKHTNKELKGGWVGKNEEGSKGGLFNLIRIAQKFIVRVSTVLPLLSVFAHGHICTHVYTLSFYPRLSTKLFFGALCNTLVEVSHSLRAL